MERVEPANNAIKRALLTPAMRRKLDAAMLKRKPDPDEARQQTVEEIACLANAFCDEYPYEEFAEPCRRLTEKNGPQTPAVIDTR